MSIFTPAWKSKNAEKALAATRKMSDQNKLLEIVMGDFPYKQQEAALHRLTDSEALRKVYKLDNYIFQQFALKELNSAELWEDAALHNKLSSTCTLAVSHIHDQTTLERIATTAENHDARNAATARLTSQELLERLARDKESHVRSMAISTMSDRHKAAEIAVEIGWYYMATTMLRENDPLLVTIAKAADDRTTNIAMSKVTDPKMIIDVISNSAKDQIFYCEALQTLSSEQLQSLCLSTESKETCKSCYDILENRDTLPQNLLTVLEKNAISERIRKCAHVRLLKNELLRRTEGTEKGKTIALAILKNDSLALKAIMKMPMDEDIIAALVIVNFECGGSYHIANALKEQYLARPELRPIMNAHNLSQYNVAHRDMYGDKGTSCHGDADAIEFDFVE